MSWFWKTFFFDFSLMTSMLLIAHIGEEYFSRRQIKSRLFPAIMVVLIISFIDAYFFRYPRHATPEDLERYGRMIEMIEAQEKAKKEKALELKNE